MNEQERKAIEDFLKWLRDNSFEICYDDADADSGDESPIYHASTYSIEEWLEEYENTRKS